MAVFEMTEDLLLGVEELDSQHRELIRRVNAVVEAMADPMHAGTLSKVVQFLEQYVVSHFDAEEAFMERIGYDRTADHRASHDRYVRQVSDLLVRLRDQPMTAEMGKEVDALLIDWLKGHICREDRRIAEFLRSQ